MCFACRHGLRALCEWSTELEQLSVGGCGQLDDEALLMLANGIPTLNSLDISGLHRVTQHGVGAVCHGCTRLTDLEAGRCKPRCTHNIELSHHDSSNLSQNPRTPKVAKLFPKRSRKN